MKSILIFLVGLFPFFFAPHSVSAQGEVGTLKKGVVKVSAEFVQSRKVGTGFIAARGKKHLFIVTASHVIEKESENPKSIHVTFFTHQEEPLVAEVVKKEGGDPRGLALLRVGGDFPEDVEILEWDAGSRFHGGEEVRLIGFPRIGGNAWAVTKGTLSGFDGPILKFSGAVEEGNSGGPLFYRNKVIGVVMEVTGQFGNAKPAQIAQFTVENWPGFPRPFAAADSPQESPRVETNGTREKAKGLAGSPGPGLASLIIATVPPDAQVFVDEEMVGQTSKGPVVVENLAPDSYEVRVKKPGFRPWGQDVDLLAGERRELTATLREGSAPDLSGVWKNPSEPTLSYVLQQIGERVTMTEVTTSVLGQMVTAQGEGQLQGNRLEIFYRTALGTMGQSTASLSDDGQQLRGTFQDFSTMIPMAFSLVRSTEAPSSFALPENEAWKAIQGFGQ